MPEETNDFVVEYRKGAMLKSFFGLLAISIVVGLFACFYQYSPHKTWKGYFTLALCPTVLFGCLVLIYGALRIMILKRPALTVNQGGIEYVSSIGDSVIIPWSRIGGFATRELPGQYGSRSMWLDVLPNGPSLKPILSVHVDQFAERPAQMLHDLKEYRANHAPVNLDVPDEQRKPFLLTYRGAVSVGLVFFFLLGIALTALPWLRSFS